MLGGKRASAAGAVHTFHNYFRELPSTIRDKIAALCGRQKALNKASSRRVGDVLQDIVDVNSAST
jgi:hypothetical protein